MRMIDADALKEKKVYSHERHEKIVPVAEIDWAPTIDAIPVEWIKALMNHSDMFTRGAAKWVLGCWKKEREAK